MYKVINAGTSNMKTFSSVTWSVKKFTPSHLANQSINQSLWLNYVLEQSNRENNRSINSGSTAGLLISYTHTNNQFANEPEGLRHFRDHRWKALGEENPDLSGLFLFRHYFESYSV